MCEPVSGACPQGLRLCMCACTWGKGGPGGGRSPPPPQAGCYVWRKHYTRERYGALRVWDVIDVIEDCSTTGNRKPNANQPCEQVSVPVPGSCGCACAPEVTWGRGVREAGGCACPESTVHTGRPTPVPRAGCLPERRLLLFFALFAAPPRSLGGAAEADWEGRGGRGGGRRGERGGRGGERGVMSQCYDIHWLQPTVHRAAANGLSYKTTKPVNLHVWFTRAA